MKKTIAQQFQSRINKADDIDAKIFLAHQAREAAKLRFGCIVDRLKFEDNSQLEINTKLKAKIIKN